jgi:non-heme chloroperoxidase
MPYTETSDNTRLFHIDWGSGKPVVFTHAWGLNSDMWNYQLPSFMPRACAASPSTGAATAGPTGRGEAMTTTPSPTISPR